MSAEQAKGESMDLCVLMTRPSVTQAAAEFHKAAAGLNISTPRPFTTSELAWDD